MWTKAFWRGVVERAVKTFVQSFIATITVAVGTKATAWDIPWGATAYSALGVSLIAAFYSLCTSIGNADFVAGNSAPSTVGTKTVTTVDRANGTSTTGATSLTPDEVALKDATVASGAAPMTVS